MLKCNSIKKLFLNWRFRKKKYTNIPFYDRKCDLWRIFFEDRFDEFGSVDYIVGEYLRDGVIYHYHNHRDNIDRDHEHSFEGILWVILEFRGKGISFEGFESDYSEQELNIINKLIKKLNEDLKAN